jgi:peptide/nickel transport system permease protein
MTTSSIQSPQRSALMQVRAGSAMRFLATSREGRVGALILVAFIAVALVGPILAPYSPTAIFSGNTLVAPNAQFWFGTDINGMDVFSRTIHAARLDLALAGFAVGLALVLGVVLGLAAGYFGGWFDLVLLRTMDVVQAFPALILGLAIVAATNQSLGTVAFVIAFIDTPVFVRLVRTETARIRRLSYVESAKAVGNPAWRVLLRHVLPNAVPPVMVQAALRLAWAVNIIAGLAFVGVGIAVPTPEWGSMIRVGAEFIASGQWWPSVFPGLAVALLTLGLNLLADGLQDFYGRRA